MATGQSGNRRGSSATKPATPRVASPADPALALCEPLHSHPLHAGPGNNRCVVDSVKFDDKTTQKLTLKKLLLRRNLNSHVKLTAYYDKGLPSTSSKIELKVSQTNVEEDGRRNARARREGNRVQVRPVLFLG